MSKLHSVVVYDALSRAIEGLGGTIGRREEEDIVRMKILRPEAACELLGSRSPPGAPQEYLRSPELWEIHQP